jgi:hypothetical protein
VQISCFLLVSLSRYKQDKTKPEILHFIPLEMKFNYSLNMNVAQLRKPEKENKLIQFRRVSMNRPANRKTVFLRSLEAAISKRVAPLPITNVTNLRPYSSLERNGSARMIQTAKFNIGTSDRGLSLSRRLS